ncbi:MAG: hypothetical protein K6D97_04780 [Clostridia bacterium]|nr:hypothetical protein [Clostridia bacterium]
MLSEENERQIDFLMEEALGNVNSLKSEFCNDCPYHEFLPDPDYHDWFNIDDQKLVCHKVKGVIEGALSPTESHQYPKPIYCPLLIRTLSNEEKEMAAEKLAYAQKRWVEESIE